MVMEIQSEEMCFPFSRAMADDNAPPESTKTVVLSIMESHFNNVVKCILRHANLRLEQAGTSAEAEYTQYERCR